MTSTFTPLQVFNVKNMFHCCNTQLNPTVVGQNTICVLDFLFWTKLERDLMNFRLLLGDSEKTEMINFINILRAVAFLCKIVMHSFSELEICVWTFFGKRKVAKKLLVKCYRTTKFQLSSDQAPVTGCPSNGKNKVAGKMSYSWAQFPEYPAM